MVLVLHAPIQDELTVMSNLYIKKGLKPFTIYNINEKLKRLSLFFIFYDCILSMNGRESNKLPLVD